RLRPAVLLDELPGHMGVRLEEALAAVASHVVGQALQCGYERCPVSSLGTVAASRFPGLAGDETVRSADVAALVPSSRAAAAELAALVASCGPVWGGPSPTECLDAARTVALTHRGCSDPLDGSPAALAQLL